MNFNNWLCALVVAIVVATSVLGLAGLWGALIKLCVWGWGCVL